MQPILVAYATEHGSTREVAMAIAARLREQSLEVVVLPAAEVRDLEPYGGVILGGALYIGRWHADALAFLRRHRKALGVLPIAAFAMGPRTLEPADMAESKEQFLGALAKVPEVEPYARAVFGGVVDPSTLRFPFNAMRACDARDWDAIDAFAFECARAYDYGKAADGTRDLRTELPQTPR